MCSCAQYSQQCYSYKQSSTVISSIPTYPNEIAASRFFNAPLLMNAPDRRRLKKVLL